MTMNAGPSFAAPFRKLPPLRLVRDRDGVANPECLHYTSRLVRQLCRLRRLHWQFCCNKLGCYERKVSYTGNNGLDSQSAKRKRSHLAYLESRRL